MTMSTDEKLTETLERLAGRATTPTDGHARVERRLRTRRNRRRTGLAVAAAVSVLGISAAFVNLRDEPDSRTTAVASSGEDSTAPPSTDTPSAPAGEQEAVPRLSLSLPGLSLTTADIGHTEFTDRQMSAPLGYTHLQSFRRAPDDWSAPSIYVYTTTAEASFGLGEDSPEDKRTIVDINGNTGYLVIDGAHRSLGWRLSDGTGAYVFAPDLAAEDLLAIGKSMTLRPDGDGWDVSYLPGGLTAVIDEENVRASSRTTHSLTFAGEAGEVELHSSTASPVEMEDRIADYSVGADVSTTTIDGHPAAVARGPHDVRVLWYDPTTRVANYMILDGTIADDVEQVVSHLVVLSQDDWTDLLATADTTYRTGDESSPTSTP